MLEFYEEEQKDFLKRINGESFYNFPYLYHKYLEEDPRFEKDIFPYIKDKIRIGNLYKIILGILKKKRIKEINQYDIFLENMLSQHQDCNLNIENSPEWIKRESCKKELQNLEEKSIENIVENERKSTHIHIFNEKSNGKFLNENYFFYYSFSLLYENFVEQRKSKYSDNVDDIEKWYLKNFIKLKNADQQFAKYGLLTVVDDMEFMVIDRPRVFDKRINKTMFIKNVNISIAKLLKNLIDKKYINKISFRIDDSLSYENRYIQELLLEHIQFGKKFSFERLGELSISKLYSENLQDTLWILIDEDNITFEEIINDFDVVDDSKIVTQVIHLEYYNDKDKYYIKHIDHEYIFYTIDEFEIRQNKYSQKGTATKRLKSFKVDSSCIPFSCNEEGFILYRILDEYFVNKDLLEEYFENILKK